MNSDPFAYVDRSIARAHVVRARVRRLLGPALPVVTRVVNFARIWRAQIADTRRYLRFAAPSCSARAARNQGNVRALMMYFAHQLEKGLSHDKFDATMLAEPLTSAKVVLERWTAGGGDASDEFRVNAATTVRAVEARSGGASVDCCSGVATVGIPPSPGTRTFQEVAEQRRSLRHFGGGRFDDDRLRRAVDLAGTAPSACNRQATRVHIYSSPDQIARILDVQGGVRGYPVPPRLVAVTSDLTSWFGGHERHQPYVDAGLFAMTLLLALEEEGLAACPLSTMAFRNKDRRLRVACQLPDSEVFALLVAVGTRADHVVTPLSRRQSSAAITTEH